MRKDFAGAEINREISYPILYPTVSSSIRCGYLEGTSVADAVHRALITRAELSITKRARARASFVLYVHYPRVAHFAKNDNAPADVVFRITGCCRDADASLNTEILLRVPNNFSYLE